MKNVWGPIFVALALQVIASIGTVQVVSAKLDAHVHWIEKRLDQLEQRLTTMEGKRK